MVLNEDKEQNQSVEQKYLDPEIGIEIELKQDKLYKIKKSLKNSRIIRPHPHPKKSSVFNALDHYKNRVGEGPGIDREDNYFHSDVLSNFEIQDDFEEIQDDFEENVFMTEDLLCEIIQETQEDL